jgi:limonene 1,2-monooxygenase
MEFGIFSNGFRPHTTAAQSYEEDIREIVLADQLGFKDCYISEHHGEPPYIGKVDTIPVPEMMMCKAAALTKNIRMGAGVKLIHLHHPLDVAIQSAVVDHLLGGDRFIFGFGSGFPVPLTSIERGLSYEDRHARLGESLQFIEKCWNEDEPFDWDGEHWQAKNVVALPKPLTTPHIPMATASDSENMIKLSAERGYTQISAFLEPTDRLRKKSEQYAAFAQAVGNDAPLRNIAATRIIYLADTEQEAIEDLRASVTYETSVQEQRGFLKMLKNVLGLDVPNDHTAIDAYVEQGYYILGDSDTVTNKLQKFYDESGGFGSLLIVVGKDWATPEKRANSMRMFMEQVAPRLRDLDPA